MNSKRLLIGCLVLGIAVILLFPLGIKGLGWLPDVRNLLYGGIPLLLIGYGLVTFKRNISLPMEIEKMEKGEESTEKINMVKKSEWDSNEGWRGIGTDIWQGKVEEAEFKMEQDCKTSHYAIKFKDVNLDSMIVESDIPDEGDYEVFVEFASGGEKEGIDRLDREPFEENGKVELKGGENEIELGLNCEYSFVKIVLHRDKKTFKSPKIKRISTR